jgi:hypothetical protein
MFFGRYAAVKVAALCLLVAPGAALAQEFTGYPQQPATSRTTYRPNRALTKVIVYGAVGAIVGAVSTLRKRGGGDTTAGGDDSSNG